MQRWQTSFSVWGMHGGFRKQETVPNPILHLWNEEREALGNLDGTEIDLSALNQQAKPRQARSTWQETNGTSFCENANARHVLQLMQTLRQPKLHFKNNNVKEEAENVSETCYALHPPCCTSYLYFNSHKSGNNWKFPSFGTQYFFHAHPTFRSSWPIILFRCNNAWCKYRYF